MKKILVSEKFWVKVETLKKVRFHKVKLLKFQTFNFDLKFCWNWSFFHYEKIIDLKKVLSYLELEGQVRGTIMGVTRPLLLGPFYYVFNYVTPNISSASVAHPSIFRLFMKGNLTLILSLVTLRMCCGSYVNMIQNQKIIAQIVDVFTLTYSISNMISIKPAWMIISQYIYAV